MEDVKRSVSVVNQQGFACNTERLCINDGTMIKWIWYVRTEGMTPAAKHGNSRIDVYCSECRKFEVDGRLANTAQKNYLHLMMKSLMKNYTFCLV